MAFLNWQKTIIKGKKEFPSSTLVIITRNNQEELKNLLQYLKSIPIYQKESGQLIVVDKYSFDHTLEVVNEFQSSFSNEIIVLKRKNTKSISSLIHPYLTNQFVQVINLATIDHDNRFFPSNKLPKWYAGIVRLFSRKEKKYFDVKKIINQMEEERNQVFKIMEREVIEQLTNLQMVLKEEVEESETVESLRKMTTKLQNVMQHFDPSLYIDDTLYSNIIGFVEDFTNRTQIEFIVKQIGKEKQLQHYLGISIMRMLKQIFDFIERQAYCEKVDIKLRWKQDTLRIDMKGLNKKIDRKLINAEGLNSIEERLMLLDGKIKYNINNNEGFFILLVIPINAKENGEKTNETK